MLSAVTFIDFLLIVIDDVTTSESLWLLSPTTFTYTVFAPFVKSLYVGAVSVHVLLSVLYFTVPPLPPLTVTPCDAPSYASLYAVTVGFVALAFVIVNVPFT